MPKFFSIPLKKAFCFFFSFSLMGNSFIDTIIGPLSQKVVVRLNLNEYFALDFPKKNVVNLEITMKLFAGRNFGDYHIDPWKSLGGSAYILKLLDKWPFKEGLCLNNLFILSGLETTRHFEPGFNQDRYYWICENENLDNFFIAVDRKETNFYNTLELINIWPKLFPQENISIKKVLRLRKNHLAYPTVLFSIKNFIEHWNCRNGTGIVPLRFRQFMQAYENTFTDFEPDIFFYAVPLMERFVKVSSYKSREESLPRLTEVEDKFMHYWSELKKTVEHMPQESSPSPIRSCKTYSRKIRFSLKRPSFKPPYSHQ